MGKCILCNIRDADSAEHIFKKSQMKDLFEKAIQQDREIHLLGAGLKINKPAILQGPNSGLVKFSKSICAHCNNVISQPLDKAYDRICNKNSSKDHLSISKLIDSFGCPIMQLEDAKTSPQHVRTYMTLFKLDLIGIYNYFRFREILPFGVNDDSSYHKDLTEILRVLNKTDVASTIPYRGNVKPIRLRDQKAILPYFAKLQCCFLHEWTYPIPEQLLDLFHKKESADIYAEVYCFKPWIDLLPIMFLSHCFVNSKGTLTYFIYQELQEKEIAFFVYFELNNPSAKLVDQMKFILKTKIANGHLARL